MSSFFHLWQALLLGCGLGLCYGFLRFFRPRWLGALLFIIALLHTWVYLCFGLCGADPRMAYTVFLVGGILLWEITFGTLLRPFFSSFWNCFYGILSRIRRALKKTAKNAAFF